MITKGYGFTVEYIKWSNPAELEPYKKAYELSQKRIDEQNWVLGAYIMSAVNTAVEHNLAGRKATSEYIKEPFSKLKDTENGKLTQTEIDRQREALVQQLNIMKLNFDLEKKRQ
jgi:hypothetical protein